MKNTGRPFVEQDIKKFVAGLVKKFVKENLRQEIDGLKGYEVRFVDTADNLAAHICITQKDQPSRVFTVQIKEVM